MDEALHWFVRDRGSRTAHHLDYESAGYDHALCGHPFGEILWEGEERPRSVCRRCQERMPAHGAVQWEKRAVGERHVREIAEVRVSQLEQDLSRALTEIQRLTAERGWSDSSQKKPVHWYVRGSGSTVAHHADTLSHKEDRTLCGRTLEKVSWRGEARPRAVCRRCQEASPRYEAKYWARRSLAEAKMLSDANLARAAAEDRARRLMAQVANQRREISNLLKKQRRDVAREQGGRVRSGLARAVDDSPRRTKSKRAPGPAESWLSKGYKTPRITVVSGGLPGLGGRR
jgi:hypothetical protein